MHVDIRGLQTENRCILDELRDRDSFKRMVDNLHIFKRLNRLLPAANLQ